MSDLLKIANIIARIALVAATMALGTVLLQRIAEPPTRTTVVPAMDHPVVRAFNPDIDVPGAPIDGGVSAEVAMGCSSDPDGDGGDCDEPPTPPMVTVPPAPASPLACKRLVMDGKSGMTFGLPGAPLATVPEDSYDVSGFMDDEPVLLAQTSVWAATSDYLWTLKPLQSCQEHETTVWYRVAALRQVHPETDWDNVPAGTPFMSIRGSHG